jgi:hypothetical protein
MDIINEVNEALATYDSDVIKGMLYNPDFDGLFQLLKRFKAAYDTQQTHVARLERVIVLQVIKDCNAG